MTLHGQSNSADGLKKKKNLEIGDLPKIVWVGQCNYKRFYKERRDMSEKEVSVRGGEDPTGHCWL